jgi:PHD/YefM family antitoxin component YafN of YafNO toxin-antitoxin module
MMNNNAEIVIDTPMPVIMTGKHGNGVLISEEDFRAIQETLEPFPIL